MAGLSIKNVSRNDISAAIEEKLTCNYIGIYTILTHSSMDIRLD